MWFADSGEKRELRCTIEGGYKVGISPPAFQILTVESIHRVLLCIAAPLRNRNMRLVLSAFSTKSPPGVTFGPFNFFTQRRWRKPVVSAQTRLEDRVRDSKLDNLATLLRKLKIILNLHKLMSSRKRGPFVSLQIISRWRNAVGLNVGAGEFIHKYPHVFDVFKHPVTRNLCCKFTQKMKDLIMAENASVRESEPEAVRRVKKLLLMSPSRALNVHALRLIINELGLPDDFRESVLSKHSDDFRLVDLERVELVDGNEEEHATEVEKWREEEYREKWLSEFETKYAFPINFPTGFKMEAGFREKLRNWQRLPYVKPHERKKIITVSSCGGTERHEKRAVSVIHELLSLTVEKMVEVERLAHFRRDLAIEVNVRELLLKHPGIFYISTKGSTQTVFLREAYSKGRLIESNPVCDLRRKMMELVLLGSRNTRKSLEANCVEEGRPSETERSHRLLPTDVRQMQG